MPAVSFPTIEFAAFFVVVFILSWLLMPHPRALRPFILVASYVFYGWVDWRSVLLLVASSLVNTVAAQVIARTPSQRTRKRALIAAVVFDLGLLCIFKFLGFFVSETDEALDAIGLGSPLPLVQIVLPIGISFFTFQAISYVVDVYRGDTRAASLGDVAILQAFFPHLVAGPIVRANELLPQLRTPRDPREVLAGPGLFLIAGGLVKKTVIADELARNVVDPVFHVPTWAAWLVTFHVVCLAWVFFRSPDLSTAFGMLGQVGAGGPSPLVTLPMVFLTAAAIAVQAVPTRFWERGEAWLVSRPVAAQGVALGLLIVAADAAVGQEGVAPFIYFQF